MDPEHVLTVLRESEALLEGHFELRSGLHSDRYFQCANVLRYPRRAEVLAVALAGKLAAALPPGAAVNTVVSPALGGIIVGHELARALDAMSIFAEKDRETGALALRRFALKPGERVVVAEDVITRGGRVQETVDIAEQAGARVVAVAVLVDRSGGKARFEYPTVSLLELEPVTWAPADCPLCREGKPFTHPGS